MLYNLYLCYVIHVFFLDGELTSDQQGWCIILYDIQLAFEKYVNKGFIFQEIIKVCHLE